MSAERQFYTCYKAFDSFVNFQEIICDDITRTKKNLQNVKGLLVILTSDKITRILNI